MVHTHAEDQRRLRLQQIALVIYVKPYTTSQENSTRTNTLLRYYSVHRSIVHCSYAFRTEHCIPIMCPPRIVRWESEKRPSGQILLGLSMFVGDKFFLREGVSAFLQPSRTYQH